MPAEGLNFAVLPLALHFDLGLPEQDAQSCYGASA